MLCTTLSLNVNISDRVHGTVEPGNAGYTSPGHVSRSTEDGVKARQPRWHGHPRQLRSRRVTSEVRTIDSSPRPAIRQHPLTASTTPPSFPLSRFLTPGGAEGSPRWLLPGHVLASVLIQSTSMVVWFTLPALCLKHFKVGEWESLIITAAPNVMYVFSIFWQHAGRRMPTPLFLACFWLAAHLPVGLCGLLDSFWPIAALYVVACWGGAAWSPLSGGLVNRFYPRAAHGRVFGMVTAAYLTGAAAASFFVGELLQADARAYRWLLPAAAGLQGLGVVVLVLLDRAMAHTRPAPMERESGPGVWAKLIDPILHMREVLKADRLFFRYEAAYMTYGVGWMISYALLPIIGVNKLKLDYDTYLVFASMIFQVSQVMLSMPCGWLNDRIGPAKMSVLAFAVYVFFPLGLLLARTPEHLAIACAVWGVCAAGVNVGWMLGPVALAPSPDKVQHYVAIHATMVGLRGTAFQIAGVGLLKLTGSDTAALSIAALGFAWAAWQMWALRRAFAERVGGKMREGN